MGGMTIRQLRELELYYTIEPFGEYRDELRHGQQMALHLNLNRDPDKRPAPFTARECMSFEEPEEERIYTDEELEAYADKIFKGQETVQ